MNECPDLTQLAYDVGIVNNVLFLVMYGLEIVIPNALFHEYGFNSQPYMYVAVTGPRFL